MTEDLKSWDKGNRKRLIDIRIALENIRVNVTGLLYRPQFELMAEVEMAEVETVLVDALAQVRKQLAELKGKLHVD